jgi:thioredoxin 1
MPTKLLSIFAATLFVAATAFAAQAVERKPFDSAAFAATQNAGYPILVDISATWCPTCKQQKPIIDGLINELAYNDLTVFDVDFDRQKDVVRRLGANMQSTLIAFRGKTEKARSVGDTDPDSIGRLLKTTLAQ